MAQSIPRRARHGSPIARWTRPPALFRSKSAFPNHKGIIRPGQFARIKVRTDVKKGALLVPQRAVRELQGSYSVAVVSADNKVSDDRRYAE